MDATLSMNKQIYLRLITRTMQIVYCLFLPIIQKQEKLKTVLPVHGLQTVEINSTQRMIHLRLVNSRSFGENTWQSQIESGNYLLQLTKPFCLVVFIQGKTVSKNKHSIKETRIYLHKIDQHSITGQFPLCILLLGLLII